MCDKNRVRPADEDEVGTPGGIGIGIPTSRATTRDHQLAEWGLVDMSDVPPHAASTQPAPVYPPPGAPDAEVMEHCAEGIGGDVPMNAEVAGELVEARG